MDPLALLGWVAACFTTASFVPQVVKTWRSKSTRDLSMGTLLVMATGVALWLIYALWKGDAPMAGCNGAMLLLIVALIVAKRRYG